MAITTQTTLTTGFGSFIVRFHTFTSGGTCLTLSKGDLTQRGLFVRLHSACLFGEGFFSEECECRSELTAALQHIQHASAGLLVYGFQEGRGIGLEQKMRAMEIQRKTHCSSPEAFHVLGYGRADLRTYEGECAVLQELNISRTIFLSTKNMLKREALLRCGYELL